jgi:XRE family aerobic/anaerobic benzoate catabolism transcriptional regulator
MTATATDAEAAFTRALGECIRILRLDQRWSQARLAGAAGVSRVFLSAVERGLHAPNVLVLRRLAEALQVPLAVLVDETFPVLRDRPHVVSLRPVPVRSPGRVRPE